MVAIISVALEHLELKKSYGELNNEQLYNHNHLLSLIVS